MEKRAWLHVVANQSVRSICTWGIFIWSKILKVKAKTTTDEMKKQLLLWDEIEEEEEEEEE